jgi:hypothetical protein
LYKQIGELLLDAISDISKDGISINQHIYITNDEEIKEGDWIFNEEREPSVLQCIGQGSLRGWNKIILTTDQDLIKDGVQAIDDEFLEWFVNNTSCDRVEIKTIIVPFIGIGYKIIIPKEEPKQESCEYIKEVGCIKDICTCNTGPKQETLEEAAKRYIENVMRFSFTSLETKTQANRMLKCSEFGAKWQQEQILDFLYSEITERRPYSASKMCEVVIEFIEKFKKK